MNAKDLQEKLVIQLKNGGESLDKSELQSAFDFCIDYMDFLNIAKTERECVNYAWDIASKNGFEHFDKDKQYKAGDKIFIDNRGKAAMLCVVGTEPLEEGIKIVAAHIDAPRIDLKPRPFYEEAQLGLLKTHYYGGIKKYQWSALPLAMHGTIAMKDGTSFDIAIGEDDSDPVFCINDLLPHLAESQMKRTLYDGIRGEELNVLAGSLPYNEGEDLDKVSEKIKLNILSIIFEKYGIIEEDFISADIEMVPALKARDVGFDRSMIGAYAHDDRVCSYTAIKALVDNPVPKHTSLVVLADKEEIGSNGATGLKAHFMRYFIMDLCDIMGAKFTTVMSESKCLSADVAAAFDPTFAEVYEKNNSAYLNYGVAIAKYTGARGKSSSSEAAAEFMAEIRNLFDENGVMWQVCELGRVDAGGGGTVASYVAELDIDTVDVGVPVLSMHAPYETISKIDTYMTYKAFKCFMD